MRQIKFRFRKQPSAAFGRMGALDVCDVHFLKGQTVSFEHD